MSEFVLMTDSSADLSQEMVQELGVTVLPLSFTIQGKVYRNYPDNREMDLPLFYDMLRAGELATTSAVNVAEYTQAVEPILQEKKDVLILAFSSGLSSTYQASVLAAEELREKYPDRKIYTVDTLCASLGQGLLVYLAVQEQRKGRSIEEVRDWAEATTAVVGSMLQIKPVLHVDNEGRLINIGKARGRQASLKALVDKMEKTVTEEGKKTVFISHGDCRKDAVAVADMVRERFGTQDIRINYVGPVIGAHSGPGTLALFYLGTER